VTCDTLHSALQPAGKGGSSCSWSHAQHCMMMMLIIIVVMMMMMMMLIIDVVIGGLVL